MARTGLVGEYYGVMRTETELTGWDEKGQCRSAIVCEDLPTELRARRLWRELVHDMGHGIQCNATYWPATLIRESLDFEHASVTDIVIISVHDLPRFVFAAAGWLNDWLSTRSTLPRALFILHDTKQDRQVVEMLRKLTEFAGVTLFNRDYDANDGLPAGDIEPSRQSEEELALAL